MGQLVKPTRALRSIQAPLTLSPLILEPQLRRECRRPNSEIDYFRTKSRILSLALLILLPWGAQAAAAISLVQQATTANHNSAGTYTINLRSATTVGNLVTVCVQLGTASSTVNVSGMEAGLSLFDRTVTFPTGLTGSQAYITIARSGACGETFTLYKNGSSFGTAVFAQNATTVASLATFSAGDVLTITAPSPQDSALLNPTINLVGAQQ